MISLILKELLSSKNKIIFSSYFLLMITIFIMPLPLFASELDIFINQTYYVMQYQELTNELFKLIIPIYFLLLVSDHDWKFLNNLTTYFSRFKIIRSKLIVYIYLNLLNFLLMTLLMLLIPWIFNYQFLISNEFILSNLPLFFDMLLITLLILLLNRNHHKYYAYLVVSLYVLLNFFYSFNLVIIIYYLIPFYNNYFTHYQNSFLYQQVYIATLLILNILKYLNEDFY